MSGDSPVLTIPEVADALRVSRWCIYDRIRRGEIKAVHVGRAVRVPRVWLEQLLAEAGEEATA